MLRKATCAIAVAAAIAASAASAAPKNGTYTQKVMGLIAPFTVNVTIENGKIAKVEMSAYVTKTNRKKLLSAFSDKAPLARALYLKEDCELLLTSSNGRRLAVHTAVIAPKTTKNTQGVSVMTQRKGHRVTGVEIAPPEHPFIGRYRTRSLPAAGKLPAQEEAGEQLTL